jgi:hypothetical protein
MSSGENLARPDEVDWSTAPQKSDIHDIGKKTRFNGEK